MSWAAVTARGTLTRWVLIGSGSLVLLLLLAGAVIGQTTAELGRAQERRIEDVEAARKDAVSLLVAYVDQESSVRGYVITMREDFLDPYAKAGRQIPALTSSLRGHVARLGLPERTIGEVDDAYRTWSEYARGQITRVELGEQDDAMEEVLSGRGKARFDEIRAAYRGLAHELDRTAAQAHTETTRLERRLVWLLVLALVGLAAVVVVGTWVLVVAVAWPVARLAHGTRAVASGHLAAPLPATGAGEIKTLATDVTAMRDRLTVDLDVAKRAIDGAKQNSPAVAALREALLPNPASIQGLTVSGRLDSAEGVLAGDWYDVIATSGHTASIVVGDVSGHGPGSAVLALRFRHALAAALQAGASPGQSLTVLGADLSRLPDDMFATILVITVDTRLGTLTYANAGHPAGLLLGTSTAGIGGAKPELEADPGWRQVSDAVALQWLDLPVTGPLLSPIVSGWAWGEREISFRPGDTLLAFTDGLIEARDPAGEQFGVRRVLDVVAMTGVDDGQRLIEAICAAAVRHTGFRTRQDDQTIVYARRQDTVVQQATPGAESIPAPAQAPSTS